MTGLPDPRQNCFLVEKGFLLGTLDKPTCHLMLHGPYQVWGLLRSSSRNIFSRRAVANAHSVSSFILPFLDDTNNAHRA